MVDVVAQLEVNMFNHWTFEDIEVSYLSLEDYMKVLEDKNATFIPNTIGWYLGKYFHNAQFRIVEKLTNYLIMHERNNGKKLLVVHIKHVMEIIHLLTNQNLIQVIVNTIINTGPREYAT
eukprot:Gb_28647 [translate_table: standard]